MWIELNTADVTAARPIPRKTLVPVETLTVRERPGSKTSDLKAEVFVGGHWRGTTETYAEILDRLRAALGLEHLTERQDPADADRSLAGELVAWADAEGYDETLATFRRALKKDPTANPLGQVLARAREVLAAPGDFVDGQPLAGTPAYCAARDEAMATAPECAPVTVTVPVDEVTTTGSVDALAEEVSTLRDRDVEEADTHDAAQILTRLRNRGWHLIFRDVS